MSSRNKHPVVDTKPITNIMALKSNEDLSSYLEDRPELNLSLMRQKNGSTLLHFACYKNELSKLKMYILHFEAYAKQNLKHSKHDPSFDNQLKAWINVNNNEGMTAAHFAAFHGNIEMIDFLQRYGANMKATNNKREDILFTAVERNQLKTVAYLLQHRNGKLPFNPNAQNIQGNTPLHIAASQGHYALVSYLLSLSPEDLERDPVNNEGLTPLMLAVNEGNKDIIKRMLVKGVNRHLTDTQSQRAIDMARAMGRTQLVRILNDDFGSCDKIKIRCNVKLVYQVQKPSKAYSVIFLLIFNLLFLPSNIFAEVTFLDSPYYFYAITAVYYFLVMVLFCLLTKKHPKKVAKDIQEIELPMCPECRSTVRANQFHCFTCGVCVWRYDHHCPWINNCVSSLNIGKFILFLVLIIISCVQVMFIALCLQTQCLTAIKKTTLIPLSNEVLDIIILVNAIISSLLSAIICIMLFNLLGDQLQNLISNSTSYQRAKNFKSSTLLTAQDRTSLNDTQYEYQVQQQEQKSCFANCRSMLGQKYEVSDS